jgi:hypothetical protein
MVRLRIKLKGKVVEHLCSEREVESILECGWDEACIELQGRWFSLVDARWTPRDTQPF